MYIKDSFESKYQLLINGEEKVEIKQLENSKAFLDYSKENDDVYENLTDHNLTKKREMLIVNCFKRKKTQHFNCFYQ